MPTPDLNSPVPTPRAILMVSLALMLACIACAIASGCSGCGPGPASRNWPGRTP